PAPYQAKSRSPPCPMGAAASSFGPLINPSSETASPGRTFPMFGLLSRRISPPAVRRADPRPALSHASPIPAAQILVIDIVLDSPTTRRPRRANARLSQVNTAGYLCCGLPGTGLLAQPGNQAAGGPGRGS